MPSARGESGPVVGDAEVRTQIVPWCLQLERHTHYVSLQRSASLMSISASRQVPRATTGLQSLSKTGPEL